MKSNFDGFNFNELLESEMKKISVPELELLRNICNNIISLAKIAKPYSSATFHARIQYEFSQYQFIKFADFAKVTKNGLLTSTAERNSLIDIAEYAIFTIDQLITATKRSQAIGTISRNLLDSIDSIK